MPSAKIPASRASAKISFQSRELLNGQEVMTLIDNLNDVIPVEQQTYTIHGDKTIDQKKVLLQMLKHIRKGELTVNYIYSKCSMVHGRQYARLGQSVQSLSRVLRHTLCGKTYRDYDIKNCHPTIALHYCNMKGWDVPFLTKYVQHRDECIKEVLSLNPELTKDYVKRNLFISILNGGSADYKALKHKTETLNGLYAEINNVFHKMLELDENQSILHEVRENEKKKPVGLQKNSEGIRRSVCNKVWVDIENDILCCCIKWLQDNGYDVRNIVLMFDGFMLPKNVRLPENWASILSTYVRIHSKSGITVEFMEKEMDEGVDISKFPIKNVYQEALYDNCVDDEMLVHFAYHRTDYDMANLIYHLMNGRFAYDGNRMYVFKNHKWEDYGDDVFAHEVGLFYEIYDKLIEQAQYTLQQKRNAGVEEADEDKELVDELKKAQAMFKSSSSIKRAKDIFKGRIINPEFISLLDSKAGIIGFKNGVLDLTDEKPVFRDGKPDDFVSLSTRYEYQDVESTSIAEDFLKDIVDEDTYEPMLNFISSLLIGGNKSHKATFWVGRGSNGKSLLSEIIEKVLGDYVRNVSKDIYTKEKKHAGGAEPHLMELRGRLVGLTAEPEENDLFISGVFKSLSSADTITTRGMFDKKQTIFKPLHKPIIATNHLPKFTSFDDGVARRIRIFRFPYQFVSNPVNNDEDGIIRQKLKDEDKGEVLKSPMVILQFLKLMTQHCKKPIVESPSMKEAIDEYFSELNPLSKWFRECYEPDTDGKIRVSELLCDYNANNKEMSATKFGGYLGKLGVVKKCKDANYLIGYRKKTYGFRDDLDNEPMTP